MDCNDTVWHSMCGTYTLPQDEVHVWRASLVRADSQFAALTHLLSSEEHDRAGRFHFEADRKRCVLARGLLRLLLGRCLGQCAKQVQFQYNEFGKPILAGGLHPSLQFNVSHSGDLVLVALSRDRARRRRRRVHAYGHGNEGDCGTFLFGRRMQCAGARLRQPAARGIFRDAGRERKHTSRRGATACRSRSRRSTCRFSPETKSDSSPPGTTPDRCPPLDSALVGGRRWLSGRVGGRMRRLEIEMLGLAGRICRQLRQ